MPDDNLREILLLWLPTALSLAVALAAATIACRAGIAVLSRIVRHRRLAPIFLRAGESPGTAAAALLAMQLVLQSASNELPWIAPLRHFTLLLLIGTVTWLAARLSAAIADAVAVRYPVGVVDNLSARRIHTQTRVLTRTLVSVIVLVGISLALLTFPGVRNIGASLLASAGIAGLVLGVAAKPILGNLLAGLQIAVSQPIRIDDVVIVEGEWGRIEEIGRTYVVVAIWDQRRLVVPLQHFIEKPFQNWTRVSSDILGTVFLWVDYGMPVDPLRSELRRICEAAPEWDKRVCLIQVTDASERSMQLRVLVSSADASRNWDLRCLVREKLIDFIRREYPAFLPQVRADLHGPQGVRIDLTPTGPAARNRQREEKDAALSG
jgi:small-conductance mechanosensitive channel